MTMTRPLRLITLHLSQICFTDGLTFMILSPLDIRNILEQLRPTQPLGLLFLV